MSVERLTDADIESLLAGSATTEPLLGQALSDLREAAVQSPTAGAAAAHLAAVVQAVGQAPTSTGVVARSASSSPRARRAGLATLLPRLAAMSLAGFVALSMTAAAAANGVLGDTAQNVVREIGQQAGFFAERAPTEDLTDPTPPSLVPVTDADDDEQGEDDPTDTTADDDDGAADDLDDAAGNESSDDAQGDDSDDDAQGDEPSDDAQGDDADDADGSATDGDDEAGAADGADQSTDDPANGTGDSGNGDAGGADDADDDADSDDTDHATDESDDDGEDG